MAKTVFSEAMDETLNDRRTNPIEEEVKKEDKQDIKKTVSIEEPKKEKFEESPVVTEEEMDKVINVGRKKLSKAAKAKEPTDSQIISMNIPTDLLHMLDVISKIRDTNRSKYIITLIEADMKKNKDSFDAYEKIFGNMRK